jgi:hypothetical protein
MNKLMKIALFALMALFASSCASLRVEQERVVIRSLEPLQLMPNVFRVGTTTANVVELTMSVTEGRLMVEPHPEITAFETFDNGKSYFVEFRLNVLNLGETMFATADTIRYIPDPSKPNVTATLTVTATNRFTREQRTIQLVSDVPTNQPPVNSVPNAQTVETNAQLSLNFGVSDPDIGVGFYDIFFSVQHGTLTPPNGLSALGSGDVVEARGNGVYIKTTAARSASYLQGMVYTAPNFATQDTIVMTTNDRGNNGAGGQKSDTDSVSINVVAPVVVEAPHGFIAEAPAPASPLALVGDTVTCAEDETCSGAITAVGGTPPYTFSQTDDNNAGFTSLNANGSYSFFINAETSTDSPFRWGIQVTDSAGTTVSKTYTLVVTAPTPE